jgi:hypothetical protein
MSSGAMSIGDASLTDIPLRGSVNDNPPAMDSIGSIACHSQGHRYIAGLPALCNSSDSLTEASGHPPVSPGWLAVHMAWVELRSYGIVPRHPSGVRRQL